MGRMTLAAAAVPPAPSASVSTANHIYAGRVASRRAEYLRSIQKLSIIVFTPAGGRWRSADDEPVGFELGGSRLRVVAHDLDRKSTRLNSSHSQISYAVFCLKKKNDTT